MARAKILLLAAFAAGLWAQTPIRVRVDASDAPQRLFHVQMTIPAKAGPMTLLYPQWIPGEHGPTGPIINLVGLRIRGNESAIPWRRDSLNMFAFHIEVPSGVGSLEVAFDFISPPQEGGFTSGSSTTSKLAVLNWNQLLLYPQGADPDSLQLQASLRVPNAWKYGTALPIAKESGNEVEFKPASLTTIVDSPVSTGAHYRTIDLGTENGAPHYLHVAGDSDRALEASPELIERHKKLVREAGTLFGSRHYRTYHFLYTLSDHVAHFGLEHHESNDSRVPERALVDPDVHRASASLLPHEFVHSWNGKYRRPAGLAPTGKDGGFETPMKGDMLWIYEGLTNYLGEILTPRSGLWTVEEYRESLANTAAEMTATAGRTWRPLEDTTVAAQVLYNASSDYESYRRSVDFYPEGTLIWLEIDVTIRQLSKGSKSLDDFCKSFHGGPGGAPALKTYTFEDVVAALSAVQPHDWASFLNQRIRSTDARPPLGGIERSGWKLVYDGVRSDFWKSMEDQRKVTDLTYSIGLRVNEEGNISDVRFGGPAQKAGISPSVKLIAVNQRQFTPTVLRDAVAKTATDSAALELMIRNGDFYSTHRLEYRGGERYPHLVRDGAAPDILSEIIRGKTK